MLHGIEELPAEERKHYEDQLHFRPQVEQRNRYVRVPGADYLGRAFREAVAREVEVNPQLTEVLRRVERNADRYAQHFQTSDRLGAN